MSTPSRLFVYGTLIDPARQHTIAGRVFPMRAARLMGWRRVLPTVHGYPYLLADPDGAVDGAILDGIDAAAWRALDAYEDAGRLYVRRTVAVVAGDDALTCEVYVGHRIPADWR